MQICNESDLTATATAAPITSAADSTCNWDPLSVLNYPVDCPIADIPPTPPLPLPLEMFPTVLHTIPAEPSLDTLAPKKRKASGMSNPRVGLDKYTEAVDCAAFWNAETRRLKIENEELSQRTLVLTAKLETMENYEAENRDLKQRLTMLTAQLESAGYGQGQGQGQCQEQQEPIAISSDDSDAESDSDDDDDDNEPKSLTVCFDKGIADNTKKTCRFRVVHTVLHPNCNTLAVGDINEKTPELVFALASGFSVIQRDCVDYPKTSYKNFLVDTERYGLNVGWFKNKAIAVRGYSGTTIYDEDVRLIVSILQIFIRSGLAPGLTIARKPEYADIVLQSGIDRKKEKEREMSYKQFIDSILTFNH